MFQLSVGLPALLQMASAVLIQWLQRSRYTDGTERHAGKQAASPALAVASEKRVLTAVTVVAASRSAVLNSSSFGSSYKTKGGVQGSKLFRFHHAPKH